MIILGNNGGGSVPAGTLNGNSRTAAVASGSATTTVVYPTAMPDTNYALVVSLRNEVDALPIFLSIVETSKTTTGFTVIYNAPADSANYFLEYIAAREL